MTEFDATAAVLAGYAGMSPEGLKRTPSVPPEDLHPQAPEMFVFMAAHAVHNIALGSDTYLDYTVPVTALALTNCLVACERSQAIPDFTRPVRPDTWVRTEFTLQLMAELNREQHARIQQGIWRCFFDERADVAHHRLARRRRASALMLLDSNAQASLLQALTGKSLANLSLDELSHAISSAPEMLHFLTETDPKGWSNFESDMGVSATQLGALSGFLVFLEVAARMVNHSYWYDESKLGELWGIYVMAYPHYTGLSGKEIFEAICRFSMKPSEAASTLINPPFFSLHDRLLRNPCFVRSGNIMANLLTIGIRRNEAAWSKTLGSSLAKAADTLKSLLPRTDQLKVAARRKFPGGDVDLALYDTESGELLVCEVKTVYDKHGVDSLMHRYEEAKVNIERASSQLFETTAIIESGQLSMMSLFGEKLAPPTRVHKMLLTWIDPVDLTIGTAHEDIMCANFATFLALVHTSAGNVRALTTAVHELRNIWLVARMRPLDLGQPELEADLEVQMPMIDKRFELDQLQLSPLTQQFISHMSSIDDSEYDETSPPWISYLNDTIETLGAPF